MKKLPMFVTMVALATAGLSASSLTATASPAGSTSSGAVCDLVHGSISAAGNHQQERYVATLPPQSSGRDVTAGVYRSTLPRVSTHFETPPAGSAGSRAGHVILGDSLYHQRYSVNSSGAISPSTSNKLTRIGGGWSAFKYLESANYWYNRTTVRSNQYGLRSDGVLFRWSVGDAGYWKATGSAGGFASIKSMALISKTATYDTFLANLSGGALYTIRIPVTSAMKPVVKRVRASTWSGFETLLADGCGSGTTVVAIDKDTKKAYLYQMGHANGTATVIKGHGVLSGTFGDAVNFRWSAPSKTDLMSGE